MSLLHITDGSVAATLVGTAGIDGECLSWDDVLHEGPVPGGLDLAGLSDVRADFIGAAGWGEPGAVRSRFARRDDRLRALVRNVDEIVQWFEADLYDQLQLIQVLDLLAGEVATAAPVFLVEIDGHFGTRSASDMPGLFEGRREVTDLQVCAARRAWAAFRADRPTGLLDMLDDDWGGLRFLGDAVGRHLEEFPAAENGLTRTERQMLGALAGRRLTVAELFRACRECEERAFFGDTVFLWLLRPLARGPEPLIAFEGATAEDVERHPERAWRTELAVTPAGKQVLSGRGDWMTMAGRILWRGGVVVTADNDWRYHPSSATVRLKVHDHG